MNSTMGLNIHQSLKCRYNVSFNVLKLQNDSFSAGLLTSNDVLCAVMRHCKAMLPYYAAFSRLMKKFVKSHVTVWGSKAELSRVVAFTCLQVGNSLYRNTPL